MNILVIGGGIHGCCISKELIESGHHVILIEKNDQLLKGTSNATHNRIHLGYHYPRCMETAQECRDGYDIFVKEFSDCLIFPEFYYFIAKENSYLTPTEYEFFLKRMNLEINKQFPDSGLINKSKIAASYLTSEGCFDLDKIRIKFQEYFKNHPEKIIICTDFELKAVEMQNGSLIAKSYRNNQPSKSFQLEFDAIINCTYTYTNNIQQIFGVKGLTQYRFEATEIVVIENETEIPALTIMDGPFVTILPYVGHPNQYLIYDVVHSRLEKWEDKIYNERIDLPSNHKMILLNAKRYFPFVGNTKYIKSLYASRPVPLSALNDSRVTRTMKHDYPIPFYSIIEGKFATAPYVAKQFIKQLEEQLTTKTTYE